MKAILIDSVSIKQIDIENTLEALQKAVGGYIEAIYLYSGKAVMIVNEEGLLRGLGINFIASEIARTPIVGFALIVGVDGEEFTDIPEDIANKLISIFE